MEKLAEQLLEKRIRVTPGQWDRLQEAAQGTSLNANQLMVELAIEALDRREWPATEAEIRMYRASLFTAQVLARDLIDTGREEKLAEIRRHVLQMAPELLKKPDVPDRSDTCPLRAKRDRHMSRMKPG